MNRRYEQPAGFQDNIRLYITLRKASDSTVEYKKLILMISRKLSIVKDVELIA